ncbi:hypothetical protein D3C78_871200 [compost metagenome]
MTGKKFFTYKLFQSLHLLTNSRLGTTHSRSSGCKCIEISDRNKGSQQIEVEIHYRTICIYHIYSLTSCSCGAARPADYLTDSYWLVLSKSQKQRSMTIILFS